MKLSLGLTYKPFLFVLLGFCVCTAAQQSFIIQPEAASAVSGSKNTLKEKLGDSTRRAINSTTELCCVLGKVKIDFADISEKFCKISQLSKMQMHDGQIQIHLSHIQSNFTNLVEDLIDNKCFFKHASRSDLKQLIQDMNSICDSLDGQIKKFEVLNKTLLKDKKNAPLIVCNQFDVSAKELKVLQEKVKGLKCLKKG